MTRRRPTIPARPVTARPPAPRREGGQLGEGTRYVLIGGVALLALAVVGIIGFLLVREAFPSNPVVLRVGEEEVRQDYYTSRLRQFVAQQPNALAAGNFRPLGDVLLQQIADEEVLLQSLDDIEIEVTDEEVQAEIDSRIGAGRQEDFEAYRQGLRDELEAFELSEDQYRSVVRRALAQQELEVRFTEDIGESASMARFHRLDLASREDAEEARQRLLDGDEFTEVALELAPTNIEPEDGPEFALVEVQSLEVQEAINSLEPDAVSEVIETDNGFIVIQLIEQQVRPLSDSEKTSLAQSRYANYIDMRAEELGVEEDLSDDELADAFTEVL